MHVRRFFLTTLLLTLNACSPAMMREIMSPECNLGTSLEVVSAEFNATNIFFRDSKNLSKVFSLSTNEFSCSIPNDSITIHKFINDDAKYIYQEAIKLSNGINDVELFSHRPASSSFEKAAEEFCKKVKFDFMFGVDTERGPVAGCQLSKENVSAVMMRRDAENAKNLSIAALKLYSPILRTIVSN